MTPRQRAALIQTATRRESERNRNARSPKETPNMNRNTEDPEPLQWHGWLFGLAVLVIILLATGIVQIGG